MTGHGDISTGDIRVGTEAEALDAVAERREVRADFPLQRMVVVAVGSRELETAVVHRSGIHGHRRIGNTGLLWHRHTIKEVLGAVLVPLSTELQAVVEHGHINTDVISDLLLPSNVLVDEVGDS